MIKYRAWHKKYKKMYEIHVLILNSYPNEPKPKVWAKCWGWDIIDNKDIVLHVEDLEIMQYTELKDKNNKEIYQGDKTKQGWIVVKEFGCFWLTYPDTTFKVDYLYMLNNEIEIVGNIKETK